METLYLVELVHIGNLALYCFKNSCAELVGACGGSDNGLGVVAGSLLVILVNLYCNSGVGIESVGILVIDLFDDSLGLSVVAEACRKVSLELCLNVVGYLISALGSQLAEPLSYLSVIFAAENIEKSFKVGGDKDIH